MNNYTSKLIFDFRRKNTYRHVMVCILYTLFSFAVFTPFLSERSLVIEDDTMSAYYPVFKVYGESLQNNESVLWNPYLFSGFPIFLSQTAGILDPVNLFLYKALPYDIALHVRLIIAFVALLFCTYIFAQSLGISFFASFIIPFGYLAAFDWRQVMNPVIIHSMFLLPLLFWGIFRIYESSLQKVSFLKNTFYILTGALGIMWAIVSGYTQFVIYTLTLSAVWFLMLWVRLWKSHVSFKTLFLFTCKVGGGTALGLLLALPQLLPAFHHVADSIRGAGVSYAHATLKVIEPGDIANFLLPSFMRVPLFYEGRKTLYITVFLFVLFLFSIRTFGESRNTRAMFWFFAFCFVSAFKWSPIFYVMHHLPVFGLFRFPFRWMYLGVFFMVILSGFGFDFLRKNGLSARARTYISTLSLFTFASSLIVIAVNLFQKSAVSLIAWVSSFSLEHLYPLLGFTDTLAHYSERVTPLAEGFVRVVSLHDPLFVVAFLGIIIPVAIFELYKRGMSGKWFSYVGGASVIIITFSLFAVQWGRAFPISEAKALNPVDSFPEIAVDSDYFRAYPILIGREYDERSSDWGFVFPYTIPLNHKRFAIQGLSPNYNFFSNVPIVDGYDQFVPSWYLDVLTKLGSGYAAEDRNSEKTIEERINLLLQHLNLLGMMAGKYIFSGLPLPEHQALIPLGHIDALASGAGVYVYENKLAIPRFYRAASIAVDDTGDLDWMNERMNFLNVTHVFCPDFTCPDIGEHATIDSLKPELIENGHFVILTHYSESVLIVVSETNVSGWIASVDNDDVPLARVNGLYLGVFVPAGDHRIELEYRPFYTIFSDELK